MKAITLPTLIVTALLLQGCVGVAVVGSAAVATKIATDPRTVGRQVDDNTLGLRINRALSQDAQLKKVTRISVTVYQGNVLLTGQAPTTVLATRAKSIVMGVDDVRSVYNEIRQGKPLGLSTISTDTWVTTKVRSKLLSSDLAKSSDVKVVTENGEVFLLGILTRKEGQAVAKIASQISGVRHVVTAFNYLD